MLEQMGLKLQEEQRADLDGLERSLWWGIRQWNRDEQVIVDRSVLRQWLQETLGRERATRGANHGA